MNLSEIDSDSPSGALDGLSLLAPLSDAERALIVNCFVPVRYEYGDTVVSQGDLPDAYYVIASGHARVLSTASDGEEVPLNTLSAGDSFGEVALVEHSPRSATVRASTPLEVWRLDRSVFLALLRVSPAIRERFEVDAAALTRGDFLRLHPAFATLPRGPLNELVGSMEEVRLENGGELRPDQDGLYLVGEGRITAIDTAGHELYTLHSGDVAGTPQPGAGGGGVLRAQGDARLLVLRSDLVQHLTARYPEVRRRLQERAAMASSRQRGRPSASTWPPAAPPAREEELLAGTAEEHTPRLDLAPGSGQRRHRRRGFAVVRQVDAMDCGAACVATLCRQYGHDVSLPAIRAAVGTSLDGTSLRGMMLGGAQIGMELRAVKSSVDRLAAMPKPAILHWGGNHWVVLHQLSKGRAVLADPALGLRSVTEAQLAAEWTGYAALATPTARLADAPRGGLRLGWLSPFLRAHRGRLGLAAVLALAATGLQMGLPVLTQVVIDGLLQDRGAAWVSLVVGGIVVALFASVTVTILQRRILARVAVAIDGRALDYLAERLLRLPVGYFQTRRTGDIQRRLEGMREIRRVLVEDGVLSVTAVFQLVAALVVMALYSWVVALLFLAVMPLYGLLMRYSSRRLKPALDALEEAFGRYQGKQLDSIRGIEVVKASGAEDGCRRTLLHEFEGLQERLYRRDMTVLVYDGLVAIACLGIVTIFLWASALLVGSGALTIGALVAINTLVLAANAPLRSLLWFWDQLQYVVVLLGRLQDVHENKPEQEQTSHLHVSPPLEGHVQLRGVSFSFPHTPERAILRDISLDVPAGLTVAIVGRSGSGKSTLLRCLAGLLLPSEGSIEFDGADQRTLSLRDLRVQLGFVLQEPYLFDATIAENIAFGHGPADLGRIQVAATVANAAEFIERLPLGYQTRVGDSGLRLSTGQAQRISIARAVYHQPAILLMDEPTSALDTEAERAVKEGLDRLRHGRTAFVVAHRLSTIRDADLICVLEQGRLVEKGTHDELIYKRGLYAYLYSQQLAA